MATRISSAESIRLALQKDALVASIMEVISVDVSGRAPIGRCRRVAVTGGRGPGGQRLRARPRSPGSHRSRR